MSIDITLLILCLFSALAFAGVNALLQGRTTPFWINFLSFLAGLLVFGSQSILGYRIAAIVPLWLS